MRLCALLAGLVTCSIGCDAREIDGDPASGVIAAGSPDSRGLPNSPNPLVSWHFVGTASLAGNTNGVQAREILSQAASQWVLRNALDKLARFPGPWLGLDAATNPPTASLLRPWLEELLTAESRGELLLGGGGELAIVAAVRATAERSGALQANWLKWASAVAGTSPAEIKTGDVIVRETMFAGNRGWSRMWQSGGWTSIGLGQGTAAPQADLVTRLGELGASGGWLEVKANGPAVAELLGWTAARDWPKVAVQVAGRGPILRTTAQLTYARPLDVKIEPWRLPTHTLGDPVVSFTVVQGIRTWLSQQAWWKHLGLPAAPNQAVAWTMAAIPFASYVSWEMPDLTNALAGLGPKMPAFLSQYVPKIQYGQVTFQTNTTRLAWLGLPIAEPFVSPCAESDPGFAVAGWFPLMKARGPVPPELLSQFMGRTNLVLYDWELTAQRVNGWRHVKNLYLMLAGYAPPPTNHTGEAWLFDTNVLDRLGNAGTELTLVSPRQLAGVRNSALGLTGMELVALMHWLDDPAFPRLSEPDLSVTAKQRVRAQETGRSQAPGAPTNSAPSAAPAARPSRPAP